MLLIKREKMGENRSCSLKRERDGVGGYLSSDSFLSLTSVPSLVSLPLPVLFIIGDPLSVAHTEKEEN